jgi:hypothetical protein
LWSVKPARARPFQRHKSIEEIKYHFSGVAGAMKKDAPILVAGI